MTGFIRSVRNARRLTQAGLAGLAALVLLGPGMDAPPAAAVGPGAPIYVAKEVNRDLFLWSDEGETLARFDAGYDVGDELAVADVNGDGSDEVIIANDVNHQVRIMDVAGISLGSFGSSFDTLDGFAVGDVTGDGAAEILVVGDGNHDVDIYSADGDLLTSFNTAYDVDDAFGVGDLDGDGTDEIVVLGSAFGGADVYDFDGNHLDDFDTSFDTLDGFALGDVDGDGLDEIVVAGDGNHDVDIYTGTGGLQTSFNSSYDVADGFATGDVDGDGKEEIVIVGDVGGEVDIYTETGGHQGGFDSNFATGGGLAVGKASYPDADSDGLLDGWETFGLDSDADGDIDVDLPAMGADPQHKDLFLELDWAANQGGPTRNTIQALKAAFAAAPSDAGGWANPDGQPGINLWVDTGSLTDPSASEDGFGAGSCGDGIDNGPDGQADGNDPDCLAGDNLGGGNAFNGAAGCLDDEFYDRKAANFAASRRLIFRYAIFGDPAFSDPCNGGRGEIGGNDFIEFNHDAGTIMHELGHTLNLRHGGDEDMNCKPNYVSVMNYDLQFGIPQDGSTGSIIDYSPPRFPGGRGVAPLPTLDENHLDETLILDPTDGSNMMVWTDDGGLKTQAPLDEAPDWDGGGLAIGTDVKVNLNDDGNGENPAACDNVLASSTLTGHDDWSVVAVNFRPFGDSLDGALNPELEPEPTLAQMLDLQAALNTTDLAVQISDTPDPATAGQGLTYGLAVHNAGPNPANLTILTVELPAGTTHQSNDGGCIEAPVRTLTCELGSLAKNADVAFDIEVAIDADLVHVQGGPTVIVAEASVRNGDWPDSAAADNTATAETLVVAVADLEVTSLVALNPPPEMLIGETIAVELSSQSTNHGPSTPMDARLSTTADAEAGATVAPALDSLDEAALALGEQRVSAWSFDVGCQAPGVHTFTFETTIAPLHPDDVDPNPANNSQSVEVAIECVVPVALNIKPGSLTNPINPGKGVVPAAVLTTEAGEYDLPLSFDAGSIIPTSVRFSPRATAWLGLGAPESHGKGHPEDVWELDELTKDGDSDMMLHFRTALTGIEIGETEACVKGLWTDENDDTYKFFGCDLLHTVPE